MRKTVLTAGKKTILEALINDNPRITIDELCIRGDVSEWTGRQYIKSWVSPVNRINKEDVKNV